MNNAKIVRFDVWEFNFFQNTLTHTHSKKETRLEPKVSELLSVLLGANGEVLLKQELLDQLWPGVVVGDDTLARTVSRLRAVLCDSATQPTYIQTIPKRGYKMLVQAETASVRGSSSSVKPVLALIIAIAVLGSLFISLEQSPNKEIEEQLKRADGLYMEFDEQSNEAALALYQEILNNNSDNARARAGVANALVQRVVRWPEERYKVDVSNVSMTSALSSGQLDTPEARLMLERARIIAQKAVRQSPKDIQAHKSLGFVYSAEGKIDRAIEQYKKAIELDDTAWRSLINLGELYGIKGQSEKSLETFIDTYNAMQIKFEEEPQSIGPWQPAIGNLIADRFLAKQDNINAEKWANKVLKLVPFDKDASRILLAALNNQDKQQEVRLFCEAYATKLTLPDGC